MERERFPDWIDCPVAVVQKKRLCVAVNYGVRMRGSKKIGQATLLAQLIPQTKFAGSQMKRYRTGYRRWRTVVDAFAGGLSDCTVEKKSIDECLIDLTFICRQRLLMRVVPHPFAASLDKHFEARREQARERIRADPTGVLQREQTGNLRVAQEMSRTTDPLEEQDGVRLSDPVPLPFDRSKLTVAALEGQGLSAKNAATILSAFALEASMPAAEFTAMVGRTHPQRYCRARVGEVGWNACSRLTRDDLRAIVSGARGGRGEEAEAEKDGASLGQAPVWAGKVLLCDSDADEDADEDDGEGGEGCREGADQEAEEGSGEEEKGEAGEVAQRRIVSSRRRRRKYEWEVEDDVVAAAISDASAPAAADAGATVPDLRGKRRSMEGAVKGEEDEGQAAETGQGKARPRLDAVPPAAPSSSSSSCSSSSSSSSSSSASLVQLTLPNPSTTCVGSGSGSGRAPSLRYLISPFVCRGCFGWRLPWTRQAGACGEALRARSKALPLAAIIDDLVPEECECADRTVVAAGSADRAAHLLAGSAAAREKHHAGGAPAALAPAPAPAPAAGGSGGDRQGGGLSAASEPAYDPRLHTLLIALGSQLALEIRQRIFLSEGFTTACGVAPNAMVAKLASQEHKPNQQTVVLPALVRPFMRRQRLCDVPMFGPASQALAARYGLYSVKQVQDLGREGLRKQFSGPPPSLASGGGGGATEAKAGEAAHPQHQQKQEEEIEEVDDDADDDDGGGGGGGGGRHRDEHLDDLTGFADSLWRIGEGINTSPIQPRDIPKVLGRSSNRRIATDEQRRAMVLWLAEQVLIRVEDDINDNKRKPKTLVLGGYFASMPTFDPPPAPGVVLGGRKRHALGRSWQRRCLLVSLRGDDAPDPALPSSLDAAATADAAAGTVAAGTAKRETEDPREAAIRALRKSIPRTAVRFSPPLFDLSYSRDFSSCPFFPLLAISLIISPHPAFSLASCRSSCWTKTSRETAPTSSWGFPSRQPTSSPSPPQRWASPPCSHARAPRAGAPEEGRRPLMPAMGRGRRIPTLSSRAVARARARAGVRRPMRPPPRGASDCVQPPRFPSRPHPHPHPRQRRRRRRRRRQCSLRTRSGRWLKMHSSPPLCTPVWARALRAAALCMLSVQAAASLHPPATPSRDTSSPSGPLHPALAPPPPQLPSLLPPRKFRLD